MNATMAAAKLVVCGNRVEDAGILRPRLATVTNRWFYGPSRTVEVWYYFTSIRSMMYNDVTSNSLPCLFSFPDSNRINHENILIGKSWDMPIPLTIPKGNKYIILTPSIYTIVCVWPCVVCWIGLSRFLNPVWGAIPIYRYIYIYYGLDVVRFLLENYTFVPQHVDINGQGHPPKLAELQG